MEYHVCGKVISPGNIFMRGKEFQNRQNGWTRNKQTPRQGCMSSVTPNDELSRVAFSKWRVVSGGSGACWHLQVTGILRQLIKYWIRLFYFMATSRGTQYAYHFHL